MGLLGIALMLFSVDLPNNIVIDFRNLAVILSALNGGWISAVLSLFMIATFRIMINGLNFSSIAAILVLLLLVVITCTIARSKIKNHFKWLLSVFISNILTSIALVLLVKDIRLQNMVIWYYCLATFFVAVLLHYYIKYQESLSETFRRYKQESKKDFLTGLNNVRQFDSLYNEVIENAMVKQEMVSLLFIDIDFFKKINDTYGHKEGDLVLRKLGEILRKTCRSIDIISRNGGEEFSVILVDCPSSKAKDIAERIRQTVETTPITLSNNLTINITVSIGISSYPNPIKDHEQLIERADQALYEAKRTGRNRVILYNQSCNVLLC